MAYITVSIDMCDIDEQDLIDECERRGLDGPSDPDGELKAIEQAFRLGRDALALELARAMVCDRLGVIL